MLDELKFRYKNLSLWVRSVLIVILASAPSLLTYFDESPALEEQLAAATTAEEISRKNLSKAKSQIRDLQGLEEKLAFTTDQLKKAETRLPNAVQIDEVLQQVGKAAKESDVVLKQFEPTGTKTIEGEYPYDEIRFSVVMEGTFGRLGEWLDAVSGLNSKAYIKSWKIAREPIVEKKNNLNSNPQVPASDSGEISREKAQTLRSDLRLAMTTTIVFYRTASFVPPDDSKKGDPKKPDQQNQDQKPAASTDQKSAEAKGA